MDGQPHIRVQILIDRSGGTYNVHFALKIMTVNFDTYHTSSHIINNLFSGRVNLVAFAGVNPRADSKPAQYQISRLLLTPLPNLHASSPRWPKAWHICDAFPFTEERPTLGASRVSSTETLICTKGTGTFH